MLENKLEISIGSPNDHNYCTSAFEQDFSILKGVLTVKSIVRTFPSAPESRTADRSPSRKVFCLDVSTLCMGISATCKANLARMVRCAPIGPTYRKLPLQNKNVA